MGISIIRSAISSMPSAGILNMFKRAGIKVIGADLHKESAGFFMLDDFFIVPKANEANESKVVEIFLKQAKKSKAKAILSGPENEITLLAKYSEVFLESGTFIFHPPYSSLSIITNKFNLYAKVAQKINCGTFFSGENFNWKSSPDGEWIIKPKSGRGSTGVYRVNKYNFKHHQELFSSSSIVQLFAPGSEYTVDFLCDMQGNLLNCVPRKRVAIESGIAVIASTVTKPELVAAVRELCNAIEFRGYNCAQFIDSGGQFILTDVNPRIGGGSILSINASVSMKANLLALIKNKPVKKNLGPGSYRKLKMYRYYSEIYK